MGSTIHIIGAGLAGSEAALRLAALGHDVTLVERRPRDDEPVHKTGLCAELVCSNSLKSLKSETAAGMLKEELRVLGSELFESALEHRVEAGGALAVDRVAFAQDITDRVNANERIKLVHANVDQIQSDGSLAEDGNVVAPAADAIVVATGPLTSDGLAQWIADATGSDSLAFYDAAAPIVMADSIDRNIAFSQNRYSSEEVGDYLNLPMNKDEYEHFIDELLDAERVISKDFESKELFQACQPVEEIARKGRDALRFGTMKPVGLEDPRTGKRPWAVVQLRAEDAWGNSYNLVGFQTNLKFPEQQRVFRMIPGLENATFARYGVMHRNTFVNAPCVLDARLAMRCLDEGHVPVFMAGQITGTEGYCEAIRSGLHAAFGVHALMAGFDIPVPPAETAFGSLLAYATSNQTTGYQPKHVNFGDFPPLPQHIKNKSQRYAAYAKRAEEALSAYAANLAAVGIVEPDADR